MSHKPYRGSGYYGRRRHKIVFLLVLLLFLLAVFLFFYMQEYIVFTADGFRFSFSSRQEEPPADSSEDSPHLIVEDPVDPPDDEPSNNTGSTEPDEPNEPVVSAAETRALWVAGVDELDSALLRDPYNALALTVRDYDGVSILDSGTAAADAVSSLTENGGRAIALVSALRDNTAPRNDANVAVRTGSGARWLDYDYISWLNPYAEGTADVLIQLAQSCYTAGFDELVLQNFQFPTVGRTELISYGSQEPSRTEALTALLQAVREGAPGDLAISVVLTDTAASSLRDENAGQDVSLLAPLCARLYVQTQDPAFDLSALQDALRDTDCVSALLLSGQQPPQNEQEFILVP